MVQNIFLFNYNFGTINKKLMKIPGFFFTINEHIVLKNHVKNNSLSYFK